MSALYNQVDGRMLRNSKKRCQLKSIERSEAIQQLYGLHGLLRFAQCFKLTNAEFLNTLAFQLVASHDKLAISRLLHGLDATDKSDPSFFAIFSSLSAQNCFILAFLPLSSDVSQRPVSRGRPHWHVDQSQEISGLQRICQETIPTASKTRRIQNEICAY